MVKYILEAGRMLGHIVSERLRSAANTVKEGCVSPAKLYYRDSHCKGTQRPGTVICKDSGTDNRPCSFNQVTESRNNIHKVLVLEDITSVVISIL